MLNVYGTPACENAGWGSEKGGGGLSIPTGFFLGLGADLGVRLGV